MKRSKLIFLVLAVLSAWLFLAKPIYAALQRGADLQVTINGIECTVDEVYDIVPSYIVNPEDCDRDEVIERINEEVTTPQSPQVPSCSETGGDCSPTNKPIETSSDSAPVVQLNIVVLAVGLGLVAIIDQVILEGAIIRAIVGGGGRIINILKSLFRL